MKRWIIAVCLVAPACQSDALQTSAVEQGLNDCTPGGNYKGAKLPAMSTWAGTTPAAQPGQLYIDYADPSVPGRHLAFLVDPGKGTHVWGAIVKDGDLPAYRASNPGTEPMIGDCCRPPPPPPGGGNDWLASYNLEAGLRFLEVSAEACVASGLCK